MDLFLSGHGPISNFKGEEGEDEAGPVKLVPGLNLYLNTSSLQQQFLAVSGTPKHFSIGALVL